MSQRAPEQRHSGSGDVARRGSAADLPHTIQSLQTLSVAAAAARPPPPPARPPVSSQTIGDESQTGTRLAWDARLERGGQRRRDLGDSPPPSPHTSSPCVRTTPPANQSQLVCAKPIHPSTAPSLHPYRSPRHVWERRVGTCSHKHRRASFFVLMNPTKTPYPAPSREFDATSSISGTQRGCH